MLTLTGNGRLTRDVQTRTTHSGKTVATISVASDRRDRDAQPVYLDLIVWRAQAKAAAEHLMKGQAVSFSGRFEPRQNVTNTGDQRVALGVHGVDIEYGPKPRGAEPSQPGLAPPTRPSRPKTTSPSDRPRPAGRQPDGPPRTASRTAERPSVAASRPTRPRRSSGPLP
jgi:single-strand DNA-binding protein